MDKLRSEAKKLIDALSEEQLKAALAFIEFIEERERWEATKELLAIPGLLKSFRRGKKDILAGRTVSWAEIKKRNVRN